MPLYSVLFHSILFCPLPSSLAALAFRLSLLNYLSILLLLLPLVLMLYQGRRQVLRTGVKNFFLFPSVPPSLKALPPAEVPGFARIWRVALVKAGGSGFLDFSGQCRPCAIYYWNNRLIKHQVINEVSKVCGVIRA
jgi:hypothetical protein